MSLIGLVSRSDAADAFTGFQFALVLISSLGPLICNSIITKILGVSIEFVSRGIRAFSFHNLMWLVQNFFHPLLTYSYNFFYFTTVIEFIAILLYAFIKYRLSKVQTKNRHAETTLGELPRLTIQVDLRLDSIESARIIQSLKSLNYPPEKYNVQILVENKESATISPLDNVAVEFIARASFRSENEFLHYATSSAKGELIVKFVNISLSNDTFRFFADDSFESDFLKQVLEKYSCSLERPVIGAISVKRTFNKDGLTSMIINTWTKYYYDVKGNHFEWPSYKIL